jgi:membrane protease YdiL (CAAX protease family)
LAPGVLARPLARRDDRYVETFLWLDIASLLLNLLADHGPRRVLKRLPEEAGLWPPRQRRHSRPAWVGFAVGSSALVLANIWLLHQLQGWSTRPSGAWLNWTPVRMRWFREHLPLVRLLLYTLLLNIVAEECYIRGLLWSRMAWLGRWRPLANGTAWAFYHINRPLKDMLGAILPQALLASWAREFTGNIYWTAAGHYLSNAFFSILAARRLRENPERGRSSAELFGSGPP